MNKIAWLLTCLLILLISFIPYGCMAGDYYVDHGVGWHWYDDPKEKRNDKKENNKKLNQPSSNDPNAIVINAREKINTALNRVIAEPSIKNIENYLALQSAMGDRAELISQLWQKALLKRPDIDYSLKYPTSNVALAVYHEQQSKEKEVSIRAFAKQTGLFFFYRDTCPYCHRFAPILKSFAAHYGLTVIPITMDGAALPEFPDSHMDNGQSRKFKVIVTPSLFAVNPYTKKAFPVAFGLISETELRDNINKIMTQYGGISK